jgi:hypothetical protein
MKPYLSELTASVNRKGVLEVDTFKGCPHGVQAHGARGCYGLCYAAACAAYRGLDFTSGAIRRIRQDDGQGSLFRVPGVGGSGAVYRLVKNHSLEWFRIGVNGDPSHDWATTVEVCEWLGTVKVPVVVTKHWLELPGYYLPLLREAGVVFNTSISALDTDEERRHRLGQFERMREAGLRSVLRIVTCKFGTTETGEKLNAIQAELLKIRPAIDNPLRIPKSDPRVAAGDIIVSKRRDLEGETYISVNDETVYLGHCNQCPDQCGLFSN